MQDRYNEDAEVMAVKRQEIEKKRGNNKFKSGMTTCRGKATKIEPRSAVIRKEKLWSSKQELKVKRGIKLITILSWVVAVVLDIVLLQGEELLEEDEVKTTDMRGLSSLSELLTIQE